MLADTNDPLDLRPKSKIILKPPLQELAELFRRSLMPPTLFSSDFQVAESSNDKIRRQCAVFIGRLKIPPTKIFFIRRKRGLYGPRDCYNWSLIQVDLNETDPIAARDFAIYRVKWYDVNEQDSSTKPVAECRFWPKLQEFDDDSSFVRYLQMKPNKVSNHLSYISGSDWCQADVALGEDRLVGPFDFTTARDTHGPLNKVIKFPNCVDNCYWEELERVAGRRDVDMSDIRTVPITSKRPTNTGDTTVQTS